MRPGRRLSALVLGGVSLLLAASLLGFVFFVIPASDDQSDKRSAAAEKQSAPQAFGNKRAQAAPLPQATSAPTQNAVEAQSSAQANLSIGNETCLQCHGQPNLSMSLDNGDLLSLFVSQDVFSHSTHGEKGYACVQCHTTVGNYPHPSFSAADKRDVTLKLNNVCERCHSSKFELTKDSVHAAAQNAGNRNAAVCVDCHTGHAVRQLTDEKTGQPLPETRVWIPQTCAQCHYAIYQKYTTSVHGSALLGQGNPDVPTCIDCHGVHNIENPTTAAFRLRSPEICARCHTDPNIMDKYGISTQVLNTYVADFHGTTVTLFEKESPDAQTNKPVCYDCHGVHDIKRVDDPVEGLRIRQNLLARCQVCHPDASANFPTAWLSHYIPSPDNNSLVYFVNLFYKILIPGVLGGMAVLVVLDFSSLVRQRFNRKGTGRAGVFAAVKKEIAPAQAGQPENSSVQPAQQPNEAAEPESSQAGIKEPVEAETALPPPEQIESESNDSAQTPQGQMEDEVFPAEPGLEAEPAQENTEMEEREPPNPEAPTPPVDEAANGEQSEEPSNG